MRLIHLTDPHLSTLAGRTFGSVRWKRRTGYLSWIRKRQYLHRREVLERLVAAIHDESADQLILTGDLVQIGLEEEIIEAAEWLKALAPPERILFVPGNHDVYAHDSWDYLREHWHFALPPAGAIDGSRNGYPIKRRLGHVRLLGASSALVTVPFSARGSLGREQFQRLEAELLEARDAGDVTCVAIHHPPLPGMEKWRKALREAPAMEALFLRRQPAFAVCGHLHHNVARVAGETRVFGTASASLVNHASYRVFDVGTHEVHMRLMTIAEDGKGFTPAEELAWQVR